MKKLFMISLGGKAPKANIEVHDVQFVVADSIEDAIPLVKEQWYGIELKLHMDSYKEVKGIENYAIQVTDTKQTQSNQLYFAHLGGYVPSSTQEVHEIRLIVSETEQAAKSLANKSHNFDFVQRHVDSVSNVEEKLLFEDGEGYYLNLVPSDQSYDLVPDWFGYRRLDQ